MVCVILMTIENRLLGSFWGLSQVAVKNRRIYEKETFSSITSNRFMH